MMRKRLTTWLLVMAVLLFGLSACSNNEAPDNASGTSETSAQTEITGLFEIAGLPDYAEDLLNQWGKSADEVLAAHGWDSVEPFEGSQIYYVNGTTPDQGPISGVISDGTIEYASGKFGLRLDFSEDESHVLGRVQYENVAASADEAVALMDAVTAQLQQALGDPMDVGNDDNYLNLENKAETVQNLPRSKELKNVWDITPEGAAEGIYYRVIVWLDAYYDEAGENQLGYAVRIRLSTTTLENFY